MIVPVHDVPAAWISCCNCGSFQLLDHALSFLRSISAKVSQADIASDTWCCEVAALSARSGSPADATVSHCISCHFKSSICLQKHSFSLPSPVTTAPGSISLATSVLDDDLQEPCPSLQPLPPRASDAMCSTRKERLLSMRKRHAHCPTVPSSAGSFLGSYFSSPFTNTKPHRRNQLMNGYLQNPGAETVEFNNPYSGSLHTPQWDFLIQTQGRNFQPCADHHSLADCLEPPALHGVLSQATGAAVMSHHRQSCTKPRFVPKSWINFITLNVGSPEDPSKIRSFRVAMISVPQTRTTSEVLHRK